LIRGLRARIEDAKRSGLDVSAAERMLALAESAFEREDYVTARQRAGEAEFVALLATTGAFNALRFIETYWPYLLLLVVVGAVVFALAFKRKQVERLTRKIEALDKEEAQVRRLMVDAQSACFVKHEISVASYHERMASLEKRLEQISAKRSVLRSSRLALSTPEQEIERLGVERSRVLSAVKALQSQRYEKNAVSRETYESRMDEYRATLDSIDAGIAFVEAKTARDGLNKNA
jgi:hypothetical protein